jgi:hypothetical protein
VVQAMDQVPKAQVPACRTGSLPSMLPLTTCRM